MIDNLDRSADASVAMPQELAASAEAYIPSDRRISLGTGRPIPDRASGAALFADMSGFTPLTEALAKEFGPQRGAEELTAHLNRVFHALISELERYGGQVIYFSGDAVTCWIGDDDGARATACAFAMQEQMAALHDVVTPAASRLGLAMKATVAVGTARRFVVGDPAVQRIDVLAGRLIDELAAAERQAQRGEVVLDISAFEALRGRVVVREWRGDAETGRRCAVVSSMSGAAFDGEAQRPWQKLPAEVVRQWVLPDVYERLRTGRGEFLTELRPAYPLFLRFGGIDYDRDESASAKLDDFIRHVQRIVTGYGGNLLQLTLGDKGAYLYVVFGAPHAHEDDAARAAAAALELRDLEGVTFARDVQVGIAYGRLLSGTYGHPRRQTYTCLGDAVNLAARLMSKAPAGQIYVTDVVRQAAGTSFAWDAVPPVTVRGKENAIPVFALTQASGRASRGRASHVQPMVGRAAELARFAAKLDQALAGRGQVLGIAAEAGMGKSRLVAEFTRAARQRGIDVAVGECQSYGTNTAYFVWRTIWTTLFELDVAAPERDQIGALRSRLEAIDRALVARAPLLAGLLDLTIEDNELTAQFDAKLRKTSLEGLLAECLRAKASRAPILLVLEDCHWLDSLSRDLLEVLARAAAGLRVTLVLAYRPTARTGGGAGIENLPNFDEIELAELDEASAAQLIDAKLAEVSGRGRDVAPGFVRMITTRAQGNPFYIEELINYIRGRGIDPADEAALKRIELPESLHTLILSRIDTLSEAPRRTLKVASVLGRVFRASALPAIYAELGEFATVQEHLAALRAADLVNIDQEAEQTYVFKHVVTQEVAYESMPFAFRSMLHDRVGGYIENVEADAIERNVDLLAHHYWHSANLPKKREYLGRAGEAAQRSYSNAAAIDYFERLAPLVERDVRVDTLLKLGQVFEVVGQWPGAEKVDSEALALAESLGDGTAQAACETALAEVARKQGRYDEAVERLDRAAGGYGRLGNEKGVGRVLHLAGTVAAQRGDYAKAVESYQASLAIREKLDDKPSMGSLLSNLGVIAEYQGDYDRSNEFHERALALRTQIGDRRDIANSMNCLGMVAVLQRRYAEAREWFEKSMVLNREVGDAWMVAICENNLGNATRGLHDYEAARNYYAESLRAYRAYDDRWALAFLLEDIAILAALCQSASPALELLGAADALREAIGAPRAPSRVKEIDEQLAVALVALSQAERQKCRDQGRSLEAGIALEYALAFCERAGTEHAAAI